MHFYALLGAVTLIERSPIMYDLQKMVWSVPVAGGITGGGDSANEFIKR